MGESSGGIPSSIGVLSSRQARAPSAILTRSHADYPLVPAPIPRSRPPRACPKSNVHGGRS
jgi:hypothetical protein